MSSSSPKSWHGPCDAPGGGISWDLDNGDLSSWSRALRTCQEVCPFKALCVQLREEMYPGSVRPAGVIWAGVAYSDAGVVLDASGLRRLAASRRGRRRNAERTRAAAG